MTEEPKFSKHCPHCDSENIFQVTYWRWDCEKQDWVSADDDLMRCGDCEWAGYDVKTKISEDEDK